jgi:hypothetical protein
MNDKPPWNNKPSCIACIVSIIPPIVLFRNKSLVYTLIAPLYCVLADRIKPPRRDLLKRFPSYALPYRGFPRAIRAQIETSLLSSEMLKNLCFNPAKRETIREDEEQPATLPSMDSHCTTPIIDLPPACDSPGRGLDQRRTGRPQWNPQERSGNMRMTFHPRRRS